MLSQEERYRIPSRRARAREIMESPQKGRYDLYLSAVGVYTVLLRFLHPRLIRGIIDRICEARRNRPTRGGCCTLSSRWRARFRILFNYNSCPSYIRARARVHSIYTHTRTQRHATAPRDL